MNENSIQNLWTVSQSFSEVAAMKEPSTTPGLSGPDQVLIPCLWMSVTVAESNSEKCVKIVSQTSGQSVIRVVTMTAP